MFLPAPNERIETPIGELGHSALFPCVPRLVLYIPSRGYRAIYCIVSSRAVSRQPSLPRIRCPYLRASIVLPRRL